MEMQGEAEGPGADPGDPQTSKRTLSVRERMHCVLA